MKPIVRKLSAAVVALILTVVMVVTASYAWFTLSDSPVLEGMQVSIGGGDTILIAPNLSGELDGKTYYYPGVFQDTLIFSRYANEYGYLQNVAGLTPVSTADGVHWFLAERYDYNDPEVQNGEVTVGTVKPVAEFSCDTDLTHANLTAADGELAKQGSYVYLDFWVVSPGADCTLRVSSGLSGDGSFLLETKNPVKWEGGYTLEESAGHAAASARVGFLVCTDRIVDEQNMLVYQNSLTYNSDYTVLKGMYQQKGADTLYTSGYRFTVYEPNADLHPDPNLTDGAYYRTYPVGYEGGQIVEANMRYKLAVQYRNQWREPTVGLTTVDEEFAMWLKAEQIPDDMEPAEIKQKFYVDHLQRSFRSYVNAGRFVSYASYLYANDAAEEQQTVFRAEEIVNRAGSAAGATEDTYIVQLEKNVPQRIRMFIWLEGQDVDCQNLSQVFDLVLSIELAGGSR